MAKVRTISVWFGNKSNRHLRDIYVYRGYYAIVCQSAAYHTQRILRENTIMENVVDDDVFHIAHGSFTDEKYFKEVVDGHIKYNASVHGSFKKYLALMSGRV